MVSKSNSSKDAEDGKTSEFNQQEWEQCFYDAVVVACIYNRQHLVPVPAHLMIFQVFPTKFKSQFFNSTKAFE